MYLVDLLRQSKKFENLVNFIEDSGGHATRLETLQHPEKSFALNLSLDNMHKRCIDLTQDQKRVDDLFNNNDLCDDMVPQEAFQLANRFRTEHGNDLTPELVNQLL